MTEATQVSHRNCFPCVTLLKRDQEATKERMTNTEEGEERRHEKKMESTLLSGLPLLSFPAKPKGNQEHE